MPTFHGLPDLDQIKSGDGQDMGRLGMIKSSPHVSSYEGRYSPSPTWRKVIWAVGIAGAIVLATVTLVKGVDGNPASIGDIIAAAGRGFLGLVLIIGVGTFALAAVFTIVIAPIMRIFRRR